ncbi:acyltransferase [Bradyrhizobium sp. STM 3809]|uniref:acyltransferase family protein n=1 Tax=Bradyrhizobium sp. STM 3809 TaxID=551936 RepID=UPI00024092C9|nr:acyltransferase [Bradyrhizobium sp. STM 3809]CCE00935.1 putative acyltransferase [Bradyrhizobium sp. STM 3809]
MTNQRIAFIDALRAIAAMCVLVQHIADRLILANVSGHEVWQSIFVSVFDAGRLGVGAFFIVSGYVVPFSIRPPRALQTFVVGRFFRLYPAYWVSVLFAYAVLTWYKHLSIPLPHLIANATMLEMAIGVPVLLGPYWTLIIELAFYGMCVALYLCNFLHSQRVALLGMIGFLMLALALSLIGRVTGLYLHANLLLNLALMFFGLALRQADEEGRSDTERRVWFATLVLLPVSAFVVLGAPERPDPLFTPLSFLTGYLAAIAIFLLLRARLTGTKPLFAWLAKISYSVYLLHEIVLLLLEDWLSPGAGWLKQLTFAGTAVLLTLAWAALVHRWIEQPAMDAGRKISKRLRTSSRLAVAS